MLIAAAVAGAFDSVPALEIVHGQEVGLGRFVVADGAGRNALLVERPDLPALVALLQAGQRVLTGAVAERAGIVGRG